MWRVLTQARFSYTDGETPMERTIELTLDDLHAYLVRTAAQQALSKLPALTPLATPYRIDVPSVADDDTDNSDAHEREPITLTRGTLATLMAIDGRRTLAEMARRRGVLQTVANVAQLCELGLVRLEPPSSTAFQPRWNWWNAPLS